jgi:LuxR family transcriptional regulator, maltose regulon positive regulatory protein
MNRYWLTRTKLQPPRVREDLVPRRRLLSELHDAVVSHALTLVSAPAGYGKTTLLSALPAAHPDLAVGWLSLSQEDNEPACFLGGLITALQRAAPACGTRAQSLLAGLPNPDAEARRVMGALVNDVLESESGPLVLILDDLHLITEPAVYVALDYLLEHLPPQLRLVVSARHDPPLALARLRARGQLSELRLSSLRFSLEEAAAFLNDQLRLGLSREDLAKLHAGTEGWAAGLRLLAGSLDQIPTPAGRAAFVTHLIRSNSYVFDFLADEVLDHQSASVRSFLLETSILPELSPPLCRAVTGRADAGATLQEIYRRNLFAAAVDEAGTVYRYHHLFAEFLRRRLAEQMPERVAELHRRAAEAEAVPARAVSHYLAAQLWEEAATAIEQVGEQLVRDGLLHTLRGWIESLPGSVRDARPRLVYLLGVCALQRGALEEARSLLEGALRGFEAAGDEAGQGEALQELVMAASQQHDYEGQARLIDRALARPLSAHGRVQLLMARAWQWVYEGNWSGADTVVDEALQTTLQSGEPRAFGVLAGSLRTPLPLLPGGTERLERYCSQALARFGDGIGPVQAGAHSLLGYISFLRGRLDEAVQGAERARAIGEQLGGFTHLEGEVDMVLASALSARGDHAAVERHWKGRLPWIEQTPAVSFWTVTILYYIGRAQWMQGNPDRARETYARITAIADVRELPEARASRAAMRALLAMSERRYGDAEAALRGAMAIEQRMPHCLAFGSARVLLAHLYQLQGRRQAAATEIAPVLAECERGDMPGLILREGPFVVPLLRLAAERGIRPPFAMRLVALIGESSELRRAYVRSTGETLTTREVEVLRLIARGASNQQITEQLVITEHTVKTHVTSILRKLNVTSRTQAAVGARDLGIV